MQRAPIFGGLRRTASASAPAPDLLEAVLLWSLACGTPIAKLKPTGISELS